MKVLLYSFEEFGPLTINPAHEVASEIARMLADESIELVQLPVTYECWKVLESKIKECQPQLIVGIGLDIRTNRVKLEKIGLNYKHASVADNSGTHATLERIDATKQLAYETDIDLLNIEKQLKEKEIPCEISFSAGTYVCNYAYFHCLAYADEKKVQTMFIHIPASPQEAIRHNMNVATIPTALVAKALSEIIEVALTFTSQRNPR